jgi:VWFA-related protein
MIRHALAVAVAVAPLLGGGPDGRADARIVVHVAVEDANGHPVSGLPAAAFTLTVDGQPHAIESIAPASQPLSLLLLVDASRSMAPQGGRLERAVKRFVVSLDAGDRIRTGVIDDEIAFAPTFDSPASSFRIMPRDRIVVRERLKTGGTPLWDAIHQASELLGAEHGRRILLVFSDGRTSGNQHSLEEAAEFAGDTNVSVTALAPFVTRGIHQAEKTIAIVTPVAHLDRLTQYTGGRLIGGYESKIDPIDQLPTLARRLRAGYALTFSVPADGRRHRLGVRAAAPGVRVRAPMTCRAPGDS